MPVKILIVDDEWNMRNLLKIYLSNRFETQEASNGVDAIQLVKENNYDLVVLDIMLPDIDGWEVCTTIRQTKQMPILMLTARDDMKDKVYGFEIGADDYLTKPFAPEEFIARVKALLRRTNPPAQGLGTETIQLTDLVIYSNSREVYVNDKQVDLTPKEFDILFCLAGSPKQVFTRDILLDRVWNASEYRDARAIDTHVKNLREKLRAKGLHYNPIKTVWGVGYRLYDPEDKGPHE
ncbi:response regulator transcription factor [Aquibacillus salsiterrae]|uniref:Response regulator transcription factor n=1 Tax=Aquibacillus salsiterrae TaxID=2950439 RepID=A0A9X3WE22_9BACI|nr:response regulator transcription factor [Aquibacillus salsiterrae]MDC3418142.1 response regulator transcription factor [Aquibacillus salsiterrae]